VLTSAASFYSDVLDASACKTQSLCPNGEGRNNGPVNEGPTGENVYYGATTKKDRVCVDCSIACPDCVPPYKANEMYVDEHLNNIQCSEILTLRIEKLLTEA
jgi:hypothetical protein